MPSMLIAGFGTMTRAMVEGWLRAGVPASSITAYGPRAKETPSGVVFQTQLPETAPDVLVLGFKPQMLGDAGPPLEPLAGPGTTLVSVLAGVELGSLARQFPKAGGIVRMMPNLAAALGKSPIALVSHGLDAQRREVVTELAEMLGGAEWLEDESRFELVTALAGSGPGFVYRFIDALAAAATELGLDKEQAQRLAVRMVEGASALAAASQHSPAELARRVASPGGMTQAGLDVLDRDDALVDLVTQTLRAARDRGREMGQAARVQG